MVRLYVQLSNIFQEGNYEQALERFTTATHLHGYQVIKMLQKFNN